MVITRRRKPSAVTPETSRFSVPWKRPEVNSSSSRRVRTTMFTRISHQLGSGAREGDRAAPGVGIGQVEQLVRGGFVVAKDFVGDVHLVVRRIVVLDDVGDLEVLHPIR